GSSPSGGSASAKPSGATAFLQTIGSGRSAIQSPRCWAPECWQPYPARQHGLPAQVSSTYSLTALVAFVITWAVGFMIRFISLPAEYYYRQKERADRLESVSREQCKY